MTAQQFDVIVVGGGIVGATVACILATNNIKVALIDTHNPERCWSPESIDLRVSALTKASQNIFQQIDVWSAMVKTGIEAYHQMRVWDAAGDGELHFDCADTEFDELGHIAENRVIIAALWDQLDRLPDATCICPGRVASMQVTNQARRLCLEDKRTFDARLVIAADGRDSALRAMVGIDVTGWPYKQDGLVATIATENCHQATAWQRFLPTGPLAFLPLKNGKCSIVWTLDTATAKQNLVLSDEQFIRELEAASAGILGKVLAVSSRAAFPLRFQYANTYSAEYFALVGDAAHAMHPLAGQGANAGLLDAAALAELIVSAARTGRPINSHRLLRRYERWRKGDNLILLASMDVLNKAFGISSSPFKQLRSKGMNWINHSSVVKRFFNRYAMGLRDDLPQLAKDLGFGRR